MARDGGFGFGVDRGFSYRIGQGRGDVEILGAADHLRGLGRIFAVVPDSHDDFQCWIGGAQAAENAARGPWRRRHSGRENDVGLLLGDGGTVSSMRWTGREVAWNPA